MSHNPMKDRLRELHREGWSSEPTGSGHWKLTHPKANRIVFGPQNPKDRRALANFNAEIERAITRLPPKRIAPVAAVMVQDALAETARRLNG